eukprot:4652883-Amphidinium_carterae.2
MKWQFYKIEKGASLEREEKRYEALNFTTCQGTGLEHGPRRAEIAWSAGFPSGHRAASGLRGITCLTAPSSHEVNKVQGLACWDRLAFEKFASNTFGSVLAGVMNHSYIILLFCLFLEQDLEIPFVLYTEHDPTHFNERIAVIDSFTEHVHATSNSDLRCLLYSLVTRKAFTTRFCPRVWFWTVQTASRKQLECSNTASPNISSAIASSAAVDYRTCVVTVLLRYH